MSGHKIEVRAIGERGDHIWLLLKIDDGYYQVELRKDDPQLEGKLKELNAHELWKKHVERKSRREDIKRFIEEIKSGAKRGKGG